MQIKIYSYAAPFCESAALPFSSFSQQRKTRNDFFEAKMFYVFPVCPGGSWPFSKLNLENKHVNCARLAIRRFDEKNICTAYSLIQNPILRSWVHNAIKAQQITRWLNGQRMNRVEFVRSTISE
jgi:hypothetical protein